MELTFTSAAYSTGRTITWLAVAIAMLATIVGAVTGRAAGMGAGRRDTAAAGAGTA